MAEVPGYLLVHRVGVETFTGTGAYGDNYAERTDGLPAFQDEKRRMVRSSTGDQVVSETTLTLRLEHAALFTLGSVVHLEGHDEPTTVLGVSRHTDGGLGAWQHLEVNLA